MLQNIIPGPAFVKDVMEYIFSFIIVSLGVAVLYRTVPDRKTTWESAIIGGAPTAIVFHLAKEGMDIYLSRVNFDDFYGAAGSVFVLFFWVYFAVYIFLMGAQFAAVQAKTRKNFAEKHDNSNGNGDAEPKPLK
jgi:membrane protein